MFKHFICCRYNLQLYSSNVYGIKDPDQWMRNRIHFYIKHLASLAGQTNSNFKYLVFIDDQTPDFFKDQLRWMLAYFEMLDFEIIEDIPQNYFKDLKTEEDWIITSRIDNDDFYFNDFVNTIQEAFREEKEVIDVRGCQLDLESSIYYKTGRKRPNSPFISLIEKGRSTVFQFPHTIMPDKYPARFASDEELYCQVIHDHNVSNKLSGIKL